MLRKLALALPISLILGGVPVEPAHAALSWFSRANCDVALPQIPWIGVHNWYDPWSGFVVFLGFTFATTCNITQW